MASAPLPRRRPPLASILFAPFALAFLLAGCAGDRASGPNGFIAQYDAGEYAEAYKDASKTARNGSNNSASHDQAALIAGLSAHAMGRSSEAETWLRPLANSTDTQIAGRAVATLGLIEASRNQHEQAAGHLSRAASLLSGDEAAQAGMRAGDSYAALGRSDAARKAYTLAFSTAKDPNLKSMLTQRLDRAGYTIQLGAFSAKNNADKAVQEVSSMSVGLGLGPPIVLASRDARGKPIYIVQVGRFKTKGEADTMKKRFSSSTVVAVSAS